MNVKWSSLDSFLNTSELAHIDSAFERKLLAIIRVQAEALRPLAEGWICQANEYAKAVECQKRIEEILNE